MDGRPRPLPLGALEGVVLRIDEVGEISRAAVRPVAEVMPINAQMWVAQDQL
jgi:hypothetical protein